MFALIQRTKPNTVHLEYARTQICACRRGVRTHACGVETHLDAWVSRTEICDKRGTGVEMSLDAARTSAYATPAPVYLSEQCWSAKRQFFWARRLQASAVLNVARLAIPRSGMSTPCASAVFRVVKSLRSANEETDSFFANSPKDGVLSARTPNTSVSTPSTLVKL